MKILYISLLSALVAAIASGCSPNSSNGSTPPPASNVVHVVVHTYCGEQCPDWRHIYYVNNGTNRIVVQHEYKHGELAQKQIITIDGQDFNLIP